MKITFKSTIALAALATVLFLSSCSNSPKGDEAVVTDEQKVDSTAGKELAINTEVSKVAFTGNGVGKNHPGVFTINEGKLIVSDGKLTGGSFDINIISMSIDQSEEVFQTKLKGHLLSADFFDAEKYPSSKFEITNVAPYTATAGDSSIVAGANYMVSGNLTLKDSTKNVSFPAKIDMENNILSAQANFDIDRTQWGMSYGNDKSLKDKFISPTVNISLNIKSKE